MKIYRVVNGEDCVFDLTVSEIAGAYDEFEHIRAKAEASAYIRENVNGADNEDSRAFLLDDVSAVAENYLMLIHSPGETESAMEAAIWLTLKSPNAQVS